LATLNEDTILNAWQGGDHPEDVSAGGVVLRSIVREGIKRWQVVMMRRTDNGGWDLPKGHLEGTETAEEAALREVLEEVGITARIESELGRARYMASSKKGHLRKEVIYYLMFATPEEQEPRPQPGETLETWWIDLEGAIPLAVYETGRIMLLRARRYLQQSKKL
jgi:8-oxo-dGTP pyrophosphatase MutT (NUDIX family)